MSRHVIGLFMSLDSATTALQALVNAGFARDRLSIVTKAPAEWERTVREGRGEPPASETISDAVAGSLLGGLAGLVAGIVAIVVPGLGALLVAGPLGALIGGATAGALGGALVGAFRDLGLTEEEAGGFMTSLEAGAVLVIAEGPRDRATEAAEVLSESGARDVHTVTED